MSTQLQTVEPETQFAAESEGVDTSLDHAISTGWLLRFALPTILSTLVMNTFGMVDGIFAARLISPGAFAAVGVVFPFISFTMAVSFMLSIGGSAFVAKRLGEGRQTEARQAFTLLTMTVAAVALMITTVSLIFPDTLLGILGVDAFLRPLAMEYLRPMIIIIPLAMLGVFIQQYFITEGKPNLGFAVTIVGGVVSISLNFLLIGHFNLGLTGAALATGIGYSFPAFVGLVFFTFNRKGVLAFAKPKWAPRVVFRSALNGASEMVSMLAISFTTVLMNNILIREGGYEAVAAASIMWVAQGLLMSAFMGYASGIAPIVSYNFGMRDKGRIRRLFRRSMAVIGVAAVGAMALGWFAAGPIASIYVDADTHLHEMAVTATRFGLIGLTFMGLNQFTSVFFTALSNWRDSTILAVARTFVFVVAMLLTLPRLIDGVNGVWLALPAAEILATSVAVFFLIRRAPYYGYGGVQPTRKQEI